MSEKYSWHRWVRHERVPDFMAAGWKTEDTLEGTSHGHWSVHMVFAGEGDPVEPPKSETPQARKRQDLVP